MKTRLIGKRAAVIVLLILSASFQLGACTPGEIEREGFEIISLAAPLSTDLSASQDPGVQGAGRADDAIKQQHAAEAALGSVRERLGPSGQFETVEETANDLVARHDAAIQIAPTNINLRTSKAALEVIAGKDASISREEGAVVLGKYTLDEPARARFLDEYIETLHGYWALFETRSPPEEIAQARLRQEICAQYRDFEERFPVIFESKRFEPAYRHPCR